MLLLVLLLLIALGDVRLLLRRLTRAQTSRTPPALPRPLLLTPPLLLLQMRLMRQLTRNTLRLSHSKKLPRQLLPLMQK
jgi:hypothetical protein